MLTLYHYDQRLRGNGLYRVLERVTPHGKSYATLFTAARPITNAAGNEVGSHFMFDGSHWHVGSESELVAAFS